MERFLLACFGFVFLEIFGGREGGACLEKYFVCMAKQLQYFFFFSSAAWENRTTLQIFKTQLNAVLGLFNMDK